MILISAPVLAVATALALNATGFFDRDPGDTHVAGNEIAAPAPMQSLVSSQPRAEASSLTASQVLSASGRKRTSSTSTAATAPATSTATSSSDSAGTGAGSTNSGSTQPAGEGSAQAPAAKKPGGGQHGTFQISGTVSGLYPGASRPLQLTLRNSSNQSMKVTDLTVKAANSDKAGCSSSNVVPPAYRDAAGSADDIVIAGGASKTVTLQMRMVTNPPNACQAATWVLTYSGTAVKA